MAQIVSDNFNRANANTLGANWTPYIDSGSNNHSPEILNNQAANGSQTLQDSYAYYSGASWTGGSDHYAECNPIAIFAVTDGLGPGARVSFVSSLVNGYIAFVADAIGSSSSNHGIWRFVAGVKTVLSTFTATINATDIVRIEAEGSTIRFVLNGVVKSTVTDALLTTGNPGVYLQEDTASGQMIVDNWAAGDFTEQQFIHSVYQDFIQGALQIVPTGMMPGHN